MKPFQTQGLLRTAICPALTSMAGDSRGDHLTHTHSHPQSPSKFKSLISQGPLHI